MQTLASKTANRPGQALHVRCKGYILMKIPSLDPSERGSLPYGHEMKGSWPGWGARSTPGRRSHGIEAISEGLPAGSPSGAGLMAAAPPSRALMTRVAEHFRALGEPTRLVLLNALRDGERSVSELVEATGLGQANTSRHLSLLHSLDFVHRRRDGVNVLYSLADPRVFELCDIMCGRMGEEPRFSAPGGALEGAGGEGGQDG